MTRQGASLVEVLVALAILGAGLAPVYGLFSGAGRTLGSARELAGLAAAAGDGLCEARGLLLAGRLAPGAASAPTELELPPPGPGVRVRVRAWRLEAGRGLAGLAARADDGAHGYEVRGLAPDPGADGVGP